VLLVGSILLQLFGASKEVVFGKASRGLGYRLLGRRSSRVGNIVAWSGGCAEVD
jgi:hypothetical protein